MELPPINMAEVLYGQHPKLGDGLICTAVSLAGVLFNFVVMPSLDLLLGKDLHSRTEVRMLHPGQTPGLVLPSAIEPAGQHRSAAPWDRQVLQPVVPSDTSGAHTQSCLTAELAMSGVVLDAIAAICSAHDPTAAGRAAGGSGRPGLQAAAVDVGAGALHPGGCLLQLHGHQ